MIPFGSRDSGGGGGSGKVVCNRLYFKTAKVVSWMRLVIKNQTCRI